jgi:hypothetical protein
MWQVGYHSLFITQRARTWRSVLIGAFDPSFIEQVNRFCNDFSVTRVDHNTSPKTFKSPMSMQFAREATIGLLTTNENPTDYLDRTRF